MRIGVRLAGLDNPRLRAAVARLAGRTFHMSPIAPHEAGQAAAAEAGIAAVPSVTSAGGNTEPTKTNGGR